MIRSKYTWKMNEKEPDDGFFALTKKENISPIAAKILYNRGINSAEKLENFLKADLSHLHDPYDLHDMDKTVKRIRQAIENYEQILIYGDYDADGMTSASIVKEALEMLGAEVQVYLPNRFTDGYGPNQSVYKYFIKRLSYLDSFLFSCSSAKTYQISYKIHSFFYPSVDKAFICLREVRQMH